MVFTAQKFYFIIPFQICCFFQIPVVGAIEQQLKKIVSLDRAQRCNEKKSFKVQRAVKKQKETVDMIAKLKKDRLQKELLENK